MVLRQGPCGVTVRLLDNFFFFAVRFTCLEDFLLTMHFCLEGWRPKSPCIRVLQTDRHKLALGRPEKDRLTNGLKRASAKKI